MSSITPKMWAKWKDFRIEEKKDHEGSMAKSQLERSMKYAKMIYKIIDNVDQDGDGEVEFPAWVQSKLTKSQDYLQSVYNYLDGKDGLEDKFQEFQVQRSSDSSIGGFNSHSKMNMPSAGYSNSEAKKFVENDIKVMGKIFNKASQQSIKLMLQGVKSGKYDAMDLITGIKSGKAGDTSLGVRDMLQVLWNKVDKRFRSYLRGKKRR